MHDPTCERCGNALSGRRRRWCPDCSKIISNGGDWGQPERKCPMWLPRPGGRASTWTPVPHPLPSSSCRRRWCISCGGELVDGGRNYHLKRSCSKRCQQRLHNMGWGNPPAGRTCVSCSGRFDASGGSDVRCPGCRNAPKHAEANCLRCGQRFSNLMGGREHCRTCSPPGSHAPSDARREMWRRKNRARRLAKRNAGEAGRYTLAEIAERDGHRCHLCGRKVNMTIDSMKPKGPTIDHLVPISADGPDVKSNVALAHRICNTTRGAGGFAQLLLEDIA